jgi:hypothetical protein
MSRKRIATVCALGTFLFLVMTEVVAFAQTPGPMPG